MNAKIYTGNVQPNHKEFKIWVNDEGLIKTWNGTEFKEVTNGGESNGPKMGYYRVTDWVDINDLDIPIFLTVKYAQRDNVNVTSIQRMSAGPGTDVVQIEVLEYLNTHIVLINRDGDEISINRNTDIYGIIDQYIDYAIKTEDEEMIEILNKFKNSITPITKE